MTGTQSDARLLPTMRVEPGKPRFTIQPQGTGIAVSCPARRNALVLLFLVVWFGFWTFGGITTIRELMDPKQGDRAFLAFWLLGWAAGELYAIAAMAWQLTGREDIAVAGGTLTHRVSAAGLGRSREYAMAQIRNLRTSPQVLSPWMDQRTFMPPVFGAGHGALAFDYGARTYRLGAGLDEAEAGMVVAELAKRFPQLAGNASSSGRPA